LTLAEILGLLKSANIEMKASTDSQLRHLVNLGVAVYNVVVANLWKLSSQYSLISKVREFQLKVADPALPCGQEISEY
jgi:hypothetical protein